MQSIKVENPFKGLLTNGNDREINFSYFADMDKVKVSKKYLQSETYKLTKLGELDSRIKNIIETKVVFLDDDKFWYDKNISKYKPDFQKHYVVFTETKIYVFLENNFETPILEEILNGYVKSIVVNGVLKIVTEESLYFLFYKRISNVKTIQFSSFFTSIDELVVTSSIADITLNNPKIVFDIVATPMIYWLREDMQGTNIKTSLYRLPDEWKVRATATSTDYYYGYVGTVYLVRPKHNTLNFNTKGLYDFDSLAGNTFVFVPVEIQNGNICLISTSVNSTSIVQPPFAYSLSGEKFYDFRNKTYKPDTSLGLPLEITVNPENALFIGTNELDLNVFNTKFTFELLPESPYITVNGRLAITQSKFFEWFNNPDYEHRINGDYNLSVTNNGFEVTSENQQIVGNFIQTVTYIDGNEVIVGKGQVFATSSSTRVIYGVEPLRSFNSSVTQSKIYIGFGIKPSTYEMISSKAIYKGEAFDKISYYGYLDLTGILLSSMLAVYGDINEFEYINGGSDYTVINNVGFLIEGGTVYYSPNDVSNAVFYKNRYIPNVYGDALISIGGMLGVIRYNKDVTLISIQVIENEIYFKVYDTVSFVIKDRDSFLEIPDGVLMSLRDGLYLSTPQERQLLSEPINDIFEEGKVTKLLYDDYNRRIMVQYEDKILGNSIYVFDLINKVWLKFKNLQLRNIAFDGENVITIDGSSFAKVILSNDTEGRVTFHKVSLGNNKLLKRLIGLRIDLDGTLTTFTDSYGHSGSLMQSNEQLERRIEEFYIHLNNQSPTVGLDFTIGFKGKIYSIEILYEVIGEFVSTEFIGV